MYGNLIVELVGGMSVIGLSAYVFSQTRVFKRMLRYNIRRHDRVIMIIFFSGLSIVGNYMNIEVNGAFANTRPIGIITAGILGGPAVGAAVGFISGLHRYTIGGYAATASFAAAICQGLVAGSFYYLNKRREPGIIAGFVVALVAGFTQSFVILLIAKPFETALATFKTVSAPNNFVNAIGVAIFINIIKNVKSETQKIASNHAQKVLTIANMTLPYLRKGFNSFSAEKAAEAILKESDSDAVCITDDKKVLAYVGESSDHNFAGELITRKYLKEVLESGDIKIVKTKEEIGCGHKECKIVSAVVVPLTFQGSRVGGLMAFYYTSAKKIDDFDMEFAKGVGELLVTELEIARLEEQAHMVTVAEFKALQAQIHPHFLFNSLNTIASFCRTDPPKARELILNLSDFLRKSINKGEMFVTIEEELNLINSYLAIEKARFGERLNVVFDIPEELVHNKIPVLSIQPLIENSIKHGISRKPNGGKVEVSIKKDPGLLHICVKDSGIGMPIQKLRCVLSESEGIGLKNINDRLINLYGEDFSLSINSEEGTGTTVRFRIPS